MIAQGERRHGVADRRRKPLDLDSPGWTNPFHWPGWVQNTVALATLALVVGVIVVLNVAYRNAAEANDRVAVEAVEADQRFCLALPKVINNAIGTFAEVSNAQKAAVAVQVYRTLEKEGACPPR